MGRAHGVASAFGGEAWAAARRTPVYSPDAVTLEPGADPAALVARIDTVSPGASVKDSFADLDLTGAGFRVLFEAEWIHRPAGVPVTAPDLAWDAVRDPDALRDWARAWDDGGGNAGLFRPALLDDPETVVLAGRSADGRVAVGAVAAGAVTWSVCPTSSARPTWPGPSSCTRSAGCSPVCPSWVTSRATT